MVIKSVRSVRQGEVLTPSTAAYRLSNQFIGLSDYCRHIVTTVFFGNPWQSFFSHFFPFSVNDTSQFSCTILFVLTMSLWNKKQWWVMPLPVWRIELFQISTKTIDIGDHISWDATLVTSLVNIGGRLRSVERSTVSNSLGSIMHHKLILLRNVNSHSRSLYVVVAQSLGENHWHILFDLSMSVGENRAVRKNARHTVKLQTQEKNVVHRAISSIKFII